MKLALAIASYNGDPAAGELARVAREEPLRDAFCCIGVIDSGAPARCAALRDALTDLDGVEYETHDGNLGSAGNLVARLRWARDRGADAVLTVNADGLIIPVNVERMLGCLVEADAAAVYPTHVIDGIRVDMSGSRRVPVLPSRVSLARLDGKRAVRARWGSSNGALYRVAALDVVPLDAVASLWYGWEDLTIGMCLDAAGLRQLMSVDARQPTRADQRRFGGTSVVVSAKEPWTTYYSVRNLILLARMRPELSLRVLLRIKREALMIPTRDRRALRYLLAWRGFVDGLRGRRGRVVDPSG